MVKYKLLIVALLFLTSCAPSEKTLTDLNLEFILSKITLRNQYIKSINASGNITFDSPEFSNSANLEVNLKRPDTLILKVETIFGMGLGEVKIYQDSFQVVDKFNNRTMQGKIDVIIQRYLGLNIGFDEIVDILIASPRIDKIELQNFDDGELTVKAKRNEKEMVLKFNSDFELESYKLIKDGNELFEVRYSRYAKFGETTLPRVVRIWDNRGQGVYLIFSEIKVNESR